MKKKLLFVIPSLDAGGAEKSLVNLLNTLDPEKFSVDLFLFVKRGLFLPQIPPFVNIISPGSDLVAFQQPLLKSIAGFLSRGKLKLAWHRFKFAQLNKLHQNSSVAEQKSWPYLRSAVGFVPGTYDAAIGFLEKSSIYFTVDRVAAKKKLGFIHTSYSKLQSDKDIDSRYFTLLDTLVTVSRECEDDLAKNFPEYRSKITVLHNIVSAQLIKTLSARQTESLGPHAIVSVGRLVGLKGFDLAVKAAKILKEKEIPFQWYIIGEGPERANLERMISRYQLEGCFHLPGLKENPYPYIQQAAVFVQPSRYEGKSIVIDEAKILAKPIILTDFSTANDQIDHNVNGMIVRMTPEAIADGIIKYLTEPNYTAQIIANLQSQHFGTESEIERFYQIIND